MREPDRIIRLKTVLSRTGLSRSTIYRKITEGTFPSQLSISIHGAGWRESDINRWIADQVSWRPNGQSDGAIADSENAGAHPGDDEDGNVSHPFCRLIQAVKLPPGDSNFLSQACCRG
jgi:prophage regulatory protein